jgi:hypothetical protein
MIEDSAEEFLTVSSGEGSFSLPSPKRRDMGATLTLVTTTPKMENAPAAQATMIVPLWMAASQPETYLPFERHHTCHRGQEAQARAWQPTAEQWAVPR